MGQPTPPGDSPLIEGLDSSWNDIVNYIPEDKRAEFAPKFKERVQSYEALKPWEEFQKSGITPDHAGTALNLFSVIENNPREVYETIGKHLNITPQQAKEVVKEVEKEIDSGNDDPRLATLQQQVDTLAQIALANKQMSEEQQRAAEQDAKIEEEINGIKTKYGSDVPEDEILMRMLHKNMSAEEAYAEYSGRVSEIQKRRPAPVIMGAGGSVPNRGIDVKKLDNEGTKNLVAQMIQHANDGR
jgi:hypothetical protein